MIKRTWQLLWGCLLMMSVSGLVWADEIPQTKPEREGFSSERLDNITQFMNEKVEEGVMVGGMGLIARNGRIVYSEVYGQADREAQVPMADDTIHRIYSMTKPITALALMMLYEEGRFFLNDPVALYIPELANLQVAQSTADGDTGIVSDGTLSIGVGKGDEDLVGKTRAPTRQPTIRDLLTHTAGFTYGVFGNTEVDKMYRETMLMNPNMDLDQMVVFQFSQAVLFVSS